MPYTPVNAGSGGWTVRVEDADLTSTPAAFRTVLAAVARLKAAGYGDDDIRGGNPLKPKLTPGELVVWREQWPRLAPYATSTLTTLALWAVTVGNAEKPGNVTRRVADTAEAGA